MEEAKTTTHWIVLKKQYHRVRRFLSYRYVPNHLLPKEQWWLRGRDVCKSTVPAAVVLPWGESDEQSLEGKHEEVAQHLKRVQRLYSLDQTRPFKNPYTEAHHRYYGLFCGESYKGDYIYKKKADPNFPGWPHSHKPLSYSVVRRHILHREIVGAIGNHYTRHLVFDLDYHPADTRREFFLARARVFYEEMPKWFNAWFAECKIEEIGGIHFYGLTAKLHLSKARMHARAFLEYLDRTYPKLAAIESFTKIEVYPVEKKDGGGTGCRLPLCKGRVTITDEFLWGEPDDCIHLVQWLLGPNETRQHVPVEELMAFLVRNTPEHHAKARKNRMPSARGQNTGANEGMGSVGPLKGCFYRKMIDFWTGNLVPEPDTICKFTGPTLRALRFEGVAEEEAAALVEQWLLALEDTSFSDRLTDDYEELMRVVRANARRIWIDNGYQPRIEESNVKLRAAVGFYNSRGVFLSKPQTWEIVHHLAPASVDFEEFEGFQFTYDQRRLLKEHLHPVLRSRDVETETTDVYEVARRIVLFAKKYPYRELATAFLPTLCAGLKVHWHRKKSQAVLTVLVKLGFIHKTHGKVWRGHLRHLNRASRYMVGEVVLHHFVEKEARVNGKEDSPGNNVVHTAGYGVGGIVSIIRPLDLRTRGRPLEGNEAIVPLRPDFGKVLVVDTS